MNKREFNKHLNACCGRINGRKVLNENKLNALPDDVKHNLALYVIKNEGMIHPMLITSLMDHTWLHSMGYMYGKIIDGNVFICQSKDGDLHAEYDENGNVTISKRS